mmetsp:Transcript_16056/g.44998  ORF Transcript_16056/g.44998 Transcript_16056/m.44998 type:complete len:233 (-) Transcript_16056:51-749(-)
MSTIHVVWVLRMIRPWMFEVSRLSTTELVTDCVASVLFLSLSLPPTRHLLHLRLCFLTTHNVIANGNRNINNIVTLNSWCVLGCTIGDFWCCRCRRFILFGCCGWFGLECSRFLVHQQLSLQQIALLQLGFFCFFNSRQRIRFRFGGITGNLCCFRCRQFMVFGCSRWFGLECSRFLVHQQLSLQQIALIQLGFFRFLNGQRWICFGFCFGGIAGDFCCFRCRQFMVFDCCR